MSLAKIKTVVFVLVIVCLLQSTKAQDAALRVGFVNDILDLSHQTDSYFSNGIDIEDFLIDFKIELEKVLINRTFV